MLILGPTGVGKTHIAIGLTLKAIENGHRVYFLTLHDLVNKARAAREKNRLHILHTTLLRADLFILDEVGFQPLEREDATFLFEAINKRYAAQKSTIITSNKSYGQWHEIFPDPSSQSPSSTGCCITAPRSTSEATPTATSTASTSAYPNPRPWMTP